MNRTLQVFNFSVQNAANDAVDIHIDSDIVDAETQGIMKAFWGDETSTSFRSFRQQMTDKPAKTYNVILNTNGGHLGDALAMHDWILQKRGEGVRVNTKGVGIVASAGTYILMAGDEPEMTQNSWFLIHNVSGGVVGDVNEVENYAKSLRKFNDHSRDYYANYTGSSKDDIEKVMNDGQFMTAKEAKERGFIKKVTGSVDFKQTISKEQWQYADMRVLNAYNSNVKTPPTFEHSFQNQIDEMKNWIKNALGIKETKLPENADQQAILNAVVDGLVPHLEKLDEEVQTEISNQVNEALKGEAFTNAIAAAVQPLQAELETLKTKNGELETDIANKIGQPISTPANSTTDKPIGTYENDN